MQKVKPQNLSSEIEKYLKEYKEEIDEDVRKNAIENAKKALIEVKRKSPVDKYSHRGRHYADGWKISTTNQASNNYFSQTIWNSTDYQLTHLLEFGHADRSGQPVQAKPHIRETENTYKQKFIEDLERDIKK